MDLSLAVLLSMQIQGREVSPNSQVQVLDSVFRVSALPSFASKKLNSENSEVTEFNLRNEMLLQNHALKK